MKAAAFDSFGPPEVIGIKDLPAPKPGKGELLIDVFASSVNPADCKVRNGSLSFISGKKFPMITGGDFAGVVREVGEGVDKSWIGKSVYGTTGAIRKGGACAESIAISAEEVSEITGEVRWEKAAALPIAGLTALQGLRDYLKVIPGQRVLINGCTGGVGHIAVQVAKLMGCYVIGTCSERNMDFARELGADELYDYRKAPFSQLKEPVDAFFDISVTAGFATAKPVLSSEGAYLNTLPNAFRLIWWPIRNGFASRKAYSMFLEKKSEDLKILSDWADKGRLEPCIDEVFDLSNTAEAHRKLENESVRGKLAIRVREYG